MSLAVSEIRHIPRHARRLGRLHRALGFAFPYRRDIGGIVAITLALGVLNAVEPLVLKFIFDALGAKGAIAHVVRGVLVLLGFALLRELAGAISNWLTWHARLGIHEELLEATVERLHRLPLSFARTEGVGAILTRLDRSIQGFVGAVSRILFDILPAVLYLALAIGFMLHLSWPLALLVICFAPLPAAIAAHAAPEQTERERTLLDRWARIYSRFNEVLSGIVTVRSFDMEDAEKRRFLAHVGEANRVVIRGVGIDTGYAAATNLAIAIARIASVALGAVLVLQGHITVGTLVAFLGYVGGLFGPVQGLSGIYQTLHKASVSLDEIFDVLDRQEHLGDAPDARDLGGVRGDVVFDGVYFSYGRLSRPVLQGIDLSVQAGETVAIVGPSGSGKTTLMSLLMRFYDPDAGAVRIDGQDLRTLRQGSVRRAMGVVLQDPLLFNDSVRANIAYGRPDASLEAIEAAARAAHAHDFIRQLPSGYDTVVGERGGLLSVGERQRIAIARAIVKQPRIVVLDEATSSLDAESETLVQEALESLMRGRTTFVIAHRLSTVVHADRILVLRHGRIAEVGNHAALMREGGYYASLVRRQTRGLIRNEGETAYA